MIRERAVGRVWCRRAVVAMVAVVSLAVPPSLPFSTPSLPSLLPLPLPLPLVPLPLAPP